jgi:hypothetical protein
VTLGYILDGPFGSALSETDLASTLDAIHLFVKAFSYFVCEFTDVVLNFFSDTYSCFLAWVKDFSSVTFS